MPTFVPGPCAVAENVACSCIRKLHTKPAGGKARGPCKVGGHQVEALHQTITLSERVNPFKINCAAHRPHRDPPCVALALDKGKKISQVVPSDETSLSLALGCKGSLHLAEDTLTKLDN